MRSGDNNSQIGIDTEMEAADETSAPARTQGSWPMSEQNGDLLLPFNQRFAVAGSVWLIATNAPEIVSAAGETFQSVNDTTLPVALKISCYVDPELRSKQPWPQPHFRGLDHLVYAGYGSGGSMIIDLQRRRVIGTFAPAMARDSNYWRCVLLPILLGITSASIGVSALHCACVVRNGQGLILGGASGAGKSSLALALSLTGFTYLSDDWTYFSRAGSAAHAWGLPTPVKLLPDAVRYFPQLAGATLSSSLNGELAYEVDPVAEFGVDRALFCQPTWVVFVERTKSAGATFTRISSEDAFVRFASQLERLPACLADMRVPQLQTIRTLVERECWVLRHGLTPALAADELSKFCGDLKVLRQTSATNDGAFPMHADSLRRFTETPFNSTLAIGEATLRVATNYQPLADRLREVSATAAPKVADGPVFFWRIVVEADDEREPESTSVGQMNKDGLAFIILSQRSFLASDHEARQGIAFVSERFVHNEGLFHQYFLQALLSLSKGIFESG
jgi:hypothetical protein